MIFSPEPLNRLGSNFFSVDKIRCLFEWVKSACWNFSVRAAISMCTCSTSKTWSSAKVHMHFSPRKRNLFRSAKKGFISTQNCVPFWHSARAPNSLINSWKIIEFYANSPPHFNRDDSKLKSQHANFFHMFYSSCFIFWQQFYQENIACLSKNWFFNK